MSFIRFILILTILSGLATSVSANLCTERFKEDEFTAERLLLLRNPPEASKDTGFTDYYDTGYQYGAFLRHLFGPKSTQFHQWVEWLKSEQPGHYHPESGLGLYLGREGVLVMRKAETPFDDGYASFRGPNETFGQIILRIGVLDSSYLRGQSEKAEIGRELLNELLDLHLFDAYAIKEILARGDWDPITTEAIRLRDSINHQGLRLSLNPMIPYRVLDYTNVKDSQTIADNVSPLRARVSEKYPVTFNVRSDYVRNENDHMSPLHQFRQVVQVVEKTSDRVIVKIGLGKDSRPENEMQEYIQRMFFISYWQMAQKAYRKKLMEDNPESSLFMMTDFVKTLNSFGEKSDHYMIYDRYAWESMEFRMALAHKYVSYHASGAGWQPYRYQTIADAFSGLYPKMGVTVEKHPTGEFEFKRLFNNSDPDPFKLLPERDWPSDLGLYFYYRVGKELPADSTVTVISKEKGHNRMYQSFGFELSKEAYHKEWEAIVSTFRIPLQDFFEINGPKLTNYDLSNL